MTSPRCCLWRLPTSTETIPGPLLDRMEVIELSSYTREEKFQIAKRHLVKKQLSRHGLDSQRLHITDGALYAIIDSYTREAGVRNSGAEDRRRCCRKSARELVAGDEKDKINVTPAMVKAMLGPEKVKPTFISRTDAVGIANGLAWTSVGGEMLAPIEVSIIPNGSGKVEITGSLGDVMKESAHLALTYARVHAETYHIAPDKFKNTDIHIHAPEGAVPKDGPSAGVTLTTALIPALSEIPVRHDLAMTGEITLHGNVLPIGGLKEKSMAAFREGISTVLIPEANKPDLYEVDEEVKKAVKFIPVSDLSQVLKHALHPARSIRCPQTHHAAGYPADRNRAEHRQGTCCRDVTNAEKPEKGVVFMNYNRSEFQASYGLSSQLPESDRPEFVFSGRSNVGKSSLINRLCNRKNLARVSATPGKTATINFYRVDTAYFVDLPGYGYAKVSNADRERWDELINSYFEADRALNVLVQLLDSRHAPERGRCADDGIPALPPDSLCCGADQGG